jgi:hypothetical protein
MTLYEGHFELTLVQGERQGSSYSFLCRYQVFPATFVEESVFSPSCVLGSFVEDQFAVDLYLGLLF